MSELHLRMGNNVIVIVWSQKVKLVKQEKCSRTLQWKHRLLVQLHRAKIREETLIYTAKFADCCPADCLIGAQFTIKNCLDYSEFTSKRLD